MYTKKGFFKLSEMYRGIFFRWKVETIQKETISTICNFNYNFSNILMHKRKQFLKGNNPKYPRTPVDGWGRHRLQITFVIRFKTFLTLRATDP